MKKFHMKSLLLLTALVMLLTCTVSGTAAFLTVGSGTVTNTFTPIQVDTKIEETFSKDGGKTSIKILNKDDPKNIPVYVRAAIYGYWVKEGKIVAPWLGSVSATDSWTCVNGYYYYTKVLEVGTTTDELLQSPITAGTPPVEGAHLELTVVHQAIQTTPADALADAGWDWTPTASAQ